MTENPVPYASSCPRTEAEARWNRLFEAADCHSLLELAVFLGTRQSSVSDARRRGFIPSEWLLTLLRKRWINPVWILTGAGPFFGTRRRMRTVSFLWSESRGRTRPKPCSTDALITEIARRVLLQMH